MKSAPNVTRLPGSRRPARPLPEVSLRAVEASKLQGRTRPNPALAFGVPHHPPGVVPRDAPTIAQDDAITDAWGWAQTAISSAFAEGTTFLGYSTLSILAQRAEYRVMSEVIASEMTREWIEFKSTGDEDKSERIAQLEAEMKRLDVREAFRRGGAVYDGLFGRGHIYVDTGDTDDRDELKTPIGTGWDLLSRAKIGPEGVSGRTKERKIRALRPVEPVWCYPTQYDSNDPLKADWYRPTTWHVMGKEVHASRLLTFIGREVPDLLKPAYSFGGLSMSQMAKPYIDNWLRTRQAVSDLVANFSVRGLKTPGVAASLMAGGDLIFRRAEVFNNLSSNSGLMLLGNDEEFFNVTTPLSTLEQLQAQSQEHMASVSRIPLVKLLGIQPAGLNASSEGEIRAFYDWIAAFQELLFRPNLHAVVGLIMLSLWGEVDRDIGFDFKDLWQLDAAAKASVEKTKTDIDDANVAMGSISPEEVRQRIVADKDSPYSGLDLGPEVLPEPPEPDPSEMMMGLGGGPNDDVHDPHDPAEAATARAGNLASPLGGSSSRLMPETRLAPRPR